MASIDERIAALETKLKQEKAKKQQIEARKRAALKVSRQQDTRRKILVGAAILAKVERGEWPKDKLLAMLDVALTRADDRALLTCKHQPQNRHSWTATNPANHRPTSPARKAKGRCPWRGFALPPLPPPGRLGGRVAGFALRPAPTRTGWAASGRVKGSPCWPVSSLRCGPRQPAGAASRPDPPAADTCRFQSYLVARSSARGQ
jgi:hypothetical protein